ncbi:MAG TPA: DUF2272 domain-containing protein [Blastocatellia bacterium]|nr:DUF2272 domain-containing protein [Blastocatellia bacterium]HMX28473.1 DUF2272 domain-containing protein [Blastocatellia bacterium]HMY75255.1 DUF2272 domain-containing protein [Blastocatellia bacterium]
MPTAYTKKLATVAQAQYDKYHWLHEDDAPLAAQIKKYWQEINLNFPDVDTPWSAVFVSWCISNAGAGSDEFKFAAAHSVFVHWAIKNATAGTGLFQGFAISDYAPQLGDIIQHNRGGNHFDFAFATANKNYISHSAIVVETGEDPQGKYALTIGGNEGDSVGRKLVRLKPNGLIKQRENSPFICVIRNLK